MVIKYGRTPLKKNVEALKEIAGKFGKRTTPLNLIDPQVDRSKEDWKNLLLEKTIPPDRFIREASYKDHDFKITLRVNDEYLVATLEGPFDNSVICSFVNNYVNDSKIPASKVLCKKYGVRIFFDPLHKESTISFLIKPSSHRIVKALCLSPKESLHIGHGWASIYLQRFDSSEVLETLDILFELLEMIPTTDEILINFEGMPDRFNLLIPWIKRWAISDDNERSKKSKKATSKDLTRLVQAVSPYFMDINKYLESFDQRPLPEFAILLGNLAECAAEASIILKARVRPDMS